MCAGCTIRVFSAYTAEYLKSIARFIDSRSDLCPESPLGFVSIAGMWISVSIYKLCGVFNLVKNMATCPHCITAAYREVCLIGGHSNHGVLELYFATGAVMRLQNGIYVDSSCHLEFDGLTDEHAATLLSSKQDWL